MCGRYTLFTDEEYEEIRSIIRSVQEGPRGELVKTGEIYPTNLAPILWAENNRARACAAVWGFPNFRGKGVVINARSETADEKRMFQKPLAVSRCVVPTTGFYEWDGQKQKHLFRLPGTGALYLGGLWKEFEGEKRYVILTAEANASVENIHDRMPVIIPKSRIEEWLTDPGAAMALMQGAQPALAGSAVRTS